VSSGVLQGQLCERHDGVHTGLHKAGAALSMRCHAARCSFPVCVDTSVFRAQMLTRKCFPSCGGTAPAQVIRLREGLMRARTWEIVSRSMRQQLTIVRSTRTCIAACY